MKAPKHGLHIAKTILGRLFKADYAKDCVPDLTSLERRAYMNTGKLRLYVEVDGLLIPVHIANEAKLLDWLGIKHLPTEGIRSQMPETRGSHATAAHKSLTDGITDYLIDRIETQHIQSDIAAHFGIDIGDGKGKRKSKEQQRAYDKVYRNFKTARARVSKHLNGKWIRRMEGFRGGKGKKRERLVWIFKRNEAGSQIVR
jgi:hypothetical protein